MIAEYLAGCLLILIFSLNSVRGATQLECGPYQCVGQQVQYQCNVTGVSSMLWRVINDGMTLEDQPYLTVSSPSSIADLLTGAPGFSTVLSSVSSSPQLIMSSIIFTGQTNINGYTIECDDLMGDKENCSVVIPGIPSSPDNVTIHTDTFTDSSVNISWTESSSPCVTGYRYNISSSALEENIIMESTSSNNVMGEGLVSSDDQYGIVVTAIDTANRTSSNSDPVCLLFNAPSTPTIVSVTNITVSDTTDNISVTWSFQDYETSCVQVPVTSFIVSIFNTTADDDFEDLVDESAYVSSSIRSYTFDDIPKGRNYTVEVLAVNAVGEGESIRVFFPAPEVNSNTGGSSTTTELPATISSSVIISTSPVLVTSSTTITTSSTSTSISSSTSTTTTTSVNPSVGVTSTNVGAIAGGVAGGVIFILLVIVVVAIVVFFFIYRKGQTKSVDLKVAEKGDNGAVALQDKSPDVGEPLYGNDTTDGGATSNAPTYQDPSTIEREQGPTGEMYALPGKNTKPQPTQTAIGGEYAELDLTNKSSVKASDVPGPTTTTEDPGSVVYSDVRPHQ